MTAGGAIEIEAVTTLAGLEALRPEWSDLFRRAPTATPFQAPEWLLPWWRHLGAGELWALAARRAGRLVGLVPLLIDASAAAPHTRTARLIGTGVTDHLDALFDPELEADVARVALDHAAAHGRFDACDLEQLPAGSPLLRAPPPAGLVDQVAPQDACPTLPLRPAPAPLRRRLARLSRARRRAEALGPLRVDVAREGDVDELLGVLLRLHAARWNAAGSDGVLADPAVQRFHREAAAAMQCAGMLRLHALRIGDHVAAALYGFAHRGRVHYYLSGFDPALARMGPGALLLGYAVEDAIREGAIEVDFLRGQEPYKYTWGARDKPCFRRLLRRPSDCAYDCNREGE